MTGGPTMGGSTTVRPGGGSAMPSAGTGSVATPIGGGGSGGNPDGSECDVPWWGGTLEDVVGLHECPPPDDPALLAYGATQLQPCDKVTGPIGQEVVEGMLRCRYNYDERGCGIDYQGDWWVEVPVFGYGAPDVLIPESPVPATVCTAPSGEPVATSSAAEEAALLHGVWLTCREGQADPFPGNAMAFLPDGSYRALQTDAQGRLSRAQGCDSTGLWGFLPDSGQLNIHLNDHTFITFVTFTQGTPRRLTFGSLGPGAPVGANAGRSFVAVDDF